MACRRRFRMRADQASRLSSAHTTSGMKGAEEAYSRGQQLSLARAVHGAASDT
jgi:hypothetical protein